MNFEKLSKRETLAEEDVKLYQLEIQPLAEIPPFYVWHENVWWLDKTLKKYTKFDEKNIVQKITSIYYSLIQHDAYKMCKWKLISQMTNQEFMDKCDELKSHTTKSIIYEVLECIKNIICTKNNNNTNFNNNNTNFNNNNINVNNNNTNFNNNTSNFSLNKTYIPLRQNTNVNNQNKSKLEAPTVL